MVKNNADVTLSIQVKLYDIDIAGIAHNSVYLCWLDDVRCAFMAKIQPIEEQLKLGIVPVLARTDISYKRPIKFGDKVVAHLWLVGLGRFKWRIRAEFYVGNELMSEAFQEGCLVDMKTHRPIELPPAFIRHWQNNRQSGETQSSKDSAVDPWEDFSLDEPILCPV
jgi:acyl-CoA thioester hydrolase